MGYILRWKKNHNEDWRKGVKGKFWIESNETVKFVLNNYPTEPIAMIPSVCRINASSDSRRNLNKPSLLKILENYRLGMQLAINQVKKVEELIKLNY